MMTRTMPLLAGLLPDLACSNAGTGPTESRNAGAGPTDSADVPEKTPKDTP